MRYLKYFLVGIAFGIILTKSEVISWYRIYEMFKFQSFHMYGVIGSAVAFGAIFIYLIKRLNIKSIDGKTILIPPKEKSVLRYLIGGSIFGLGWALTGACPGPMFILVGNGITVFIVALISGTFGTFVYGLIKDKLPH